MNKATVLEVLGTPKWSSYGWIVRVKYEQGKKVRQGEISTLTIEEARNIKAGYKI